MRRVIAGFFQSLDGVVQAPGGPEEDPSGGFALGGWATSFFDDVLFGFLGEQIEGGDYDLLLGRRTYDIFAAHWPYLLDDPIGRKFAGIRKYVVTSRPESLSWQGSSALTGDPAAAVGALRASDGPDLLIQGSTTLYPPLLGAGLIDRLFVITMPVLLGRGKRALGADAVPTGLSLVDHRVAGTGATVALYDRGGEVPIGSFAMEDPSEAELARRAALAAEDRGAGA